MFLKKTDDNTEHANSYYAATANWQTDYPELEGELEVDVAIVGAGSVVYLRQSNCANGDIR